MAKDTASGPHLPSLSVSGFRGAKHLRIPRLGQVTLLGGMNSSGKTTVLEAVRAYAARGRDLDTLLAGRDEYSTSLDEDGDKTAVSDSTALFYGRAVSQDSEIVIGPDGAGRADMLSIKAVHPSNEQIELLGDLYRDDSIGSLVMQITFGNGERLTPLFLPPTTFGARKTIHPSLRYRYARRRHGDADLPPALNVEWLGPGVVTNRQLADMWEDIVLTDAEGRATNALAMVVGESVNRVAMFGSTTRAGRGPHVSVRFRDQATPVPLRSLGDGAVRFFAVALALARASGGFLLIDEAETGIHHRLHLGFWRTVLKAAQDGNVQVLATTQSFSCVRGFALACAESEIDQGLYVRMERSADKTKAVEYTEEELRVAAEQGIEVR